MFLKNIELHKKYKKHYAVRKKEATEAINFGFSKPEQFVSSKKKLLLILKILLTRRAILFNILARLFDEYVVFTDAETMLRNVGFLYRNQGW